MAAGIGARKGIVPNVAVQIQGLRVFEMAAHIIRRHEPSHVRSVVSSPEVIQPRLRVPFFSGEVVFCGVGGSLAVETIAEGQAGADLIDLPGSRPGARDLHANGAKRITQREVQARRRVGGQKPSVSEDVGVVPRI